jgi:hypothetical protein
MKQTDHILEKKKGISIFFFFWFTYNVIFCMLFLLYLYGRFVGYLLMGNDAFLETSSYFYVVLLVQLILPFLSILNVIATLILLFTKHPKGNTRMIGITILILSIYFILNILSLSFFSLGFM